MTFTCKQVSSEIPNETIVYGCEAGAWGKASNNCLLSSILAPAAGEDFLCLQPKCKEENGPELEPGGKTCPGYCGPPISHH